MNIATKRVLAVASAGGHWEQLMMLRVTLDKYQTCYATTDLGTVRKQDIAACRILPDCNKNTPLRAIWCALAAMVLIMRIKPHVIVSTGAAPGLFCILWGRLFGAKTLWIDSLANAEKLSLCGKLSQYAAHQCLTQWEHLASPDRVSYRGALL